MESLNSSLQCNNSIKDGSYLCYIVETANKIKIIEVLNYHKINFKQNLLHVYHPYDFTDKFNSLKSLLLSNQYSKVIECAILHSTPDIVKLLLDEIFLSGDYDTTYDYITATKKYLFQKSNHSVVILQNLIMTLFKIISENPLTDNLAPSIKLLFDIIHINSTMYKLETYFALVILLHVQEKKDYYELFKREINEYVKSSNKEYNLRHYLRK